MNIYELKRENDRAIKRNAEREQQLRADAEEILNEAQSSGREFLTRSQDSRYNGIMRDIDNCRASGTRLAMRQAEIDRVMAEEDASDNAMRNATRPEGLPNSNRSRTASVSVTREARAYRPDNDPDGRQFISDLTQEFLNGGRMHGEAAERMERHVRESMHDYPHLQTRTFNGVGTSAFTGLVVPQYLVDAYAPAVANMRPFADALPTHTLPAQGMSLNISRITTASSADVQSAELDAVSGTDMDDTLLTITVQTVAGQQVLSRQAIERGTGVEEIVVGDLLRRVASKLDNLLLNQATHGLQAVANVTTYDDTTPTASEFLSAVYQAQSTLEQKLLGVAIPNLVVMHPRRWNWLAAATSTDHPLINNDPSQLGQGRFGNGLDSLRVRGYLNNGLAVITDANVVTNLGSGTNQDQAYVVATDSLYFWEGQGSPVMIRAEQPKAAQLGVLLVAYEYFAYTHERYTDGVGAVSGTGMAAPSGF